MAADFGSIAEGMFRRMVMPPAINRLPTPGNRRYHQAKVRLRHIGAQMIAERRSDRDKTVRDDIGIHLGGDGNLGDEEDRTRRAGRPGAFA